MSAEHPKVSFVLGIFSIILAIPMAIVGLILGIVGLCVKKDPEKYGRDVALNVIGIILSILTYLIVLMILK